MSKPVILTGLRANNDLHIGNYFGALLPMIDMATAKSDEYQVNLFVPDLHSFTTPIDHSQLHDQILHNVRIFAAAGLPLDKEDIRLYRQSYVPAHSELTWILDCFTAFGEMTKMTQFKDKSGFTKNADELDKILSAALEIAEHDAKVDPDGKNSSQVVIYLTDAMRVLARNLNLQASVGLFNYPVLMAADILLYGASYVPVGDDQTQHLEFTRDIAERFNDRFGDTFTMPKPVKEQHEFFGKDQGLRIRDLVDPSRKMSKSDETGKGVIFMGDSPEAASKKIMSATTDSKGSIHYDYKEQPGISNLLEIYALLAKRPLPEVAVEFEGKSNYGELKGEVAQLVRNFLADFQKRLSEVDDTKLLGKLQQDETAMNIQANATLLRVQKAVGLRA